MMIQYYTHDCWMRYTARFQLLTLGEQKHSNWSRIATTGPLGEETLSDMYGIASSVIVQQTPKTRCLDC